jgi:hypothetical protein
MNTRFKSNHILAWLLAAALLAVSATASAHELEHATTHHDAACALHLYSGHGGALPALAPGPLPVMAGAIRIEFLTTEAPVTTRLPIPPARAPPLRS